MLSRRENLLIRPWQERRYMNHRKKVRSALPAIDNTPPPTRQHVFYKLKRCQKESERCSQIISDNFTLLQHLTQIMERTRIDNAWQEPPPSFLSRVGIYGGTRKKDMPREVRSEKEDTEDGRIWRRRERCPGCSPHLHPTKEDVGEERVPFEPPRPSLSRRLTTSQSLSRRPTTSQSLSRRLTTSQSQVPPRRDSRCLSAVVEEKPRAASSSEEAAGQVTRARSKRKDRLGVDGTEKAQSLLVSGDGLTVRLSFPPKSQIDFQNYGLSKTIQKGLCECKGFPKVKSSR